ncbi:MAG: hypothetical protein ACXVCF_03425, partial [Isosphaeraceae bacterium]
RHQFPKAPHRSSTRQPPQWLILAAKTAQFLTASDSHNSYIRSFVSHPQLFRPWIPNLMRCQYFLSSLGPFLAA